MQNLRSTDTDLRPQQRHGASARAPRLAPRVHSACAVCGNEVTALVASSAEIEVQRRYLRLFHRRRARAPRDRCVLEERAQFTHDYATRVVECVGCGLIYRDPHPPAAAIAEAYARDEYGAQRLASLFDSQLELFRPKARALRRLLRGSRPRVIEVGSFVGGFLAAMREQGAEVIGLDPGVEVADFCADRGLEVVRGTPETAGPGLSRGDCVAVWNTFDQLPRPHQSLAAIRRLLRPGGLLAIRVPNGACFRRASTWLRRGPRSMRPWLTAAMAWNNLLAFPYLQGYTLTALDRLVARYGFQRVAFRADVLTRLADGGTKWWAAQEERLLKAAWLGAAALDRRGEVHGAELAPWFDAYYRYAPPLRLIR